MKSERWFEVRGIEKGTLDLDLKFWQEQGPSAICAAAWELVVTAHQLKGRDPDELNLQRTIAICDGPG